MGNRAATILTLVGLFVAQGCALGEERVRLDPLTASVPARGVRGREVIVFPAVDARPSTLRCGMKRNAYGAETGRIQCVPEPKDWLGYLVMSGLQQAGFTLVTTKSARSADPLRLRLKLEHLFMDQTPTNEPIAALTMSADVHVTVQAETASGLVAERSFFVAKRLRADPDLVLVELSPSAVRQQAMNDATRELVANIVSAIVQLTDRYPAVAVIPESTAAPLGAAR